MTARVYAIRRWIVRAAGAALVILALSANGAPASAACTTREPTGSCYAIAQWFPSGNINGGGLMLVSQCLSVPNPNTDFVDNELWVDMTGGYWTEAGISEGYKKAGGAVYTPTFFYADQRPGGGYHEHYYGAAALNTYYTVTINHNGTNEYDVHEGPYVGYSTAQRYPANELQAGTEVTTTAAHDFSYDQYLTWYDLSGRAWGNWGSNTTLSTDPPAAAWWNTQDFSFNHGITGC